MIEFFRATGCRVDEVVRLNITDLDLNTKSCIVHGKGNKERKVYFDDIADFHMRKYLESRKDQSPALFSGRGSKRLTDEGIRVMLKRLEERSGVSNVHPHRFRRTAATTLVRKGMSVEKVAMLLGHESLNTTMRYVYQDDSDMRLNYERFCG